MRISALSLPLLFLAAPGRGQGTAVLAGRVVDARCEPIAGAGVLVGIPGALLTADALERPLARTDGDGRFVLALPAAMDAAPRARSVHIAAPGKAPLQRPVETAWSWLLDRKGRTDLGELVLEDAITLQGQVRTSEGRPLPGARVTARDLLGETVAFDGQDVCAPSAQSHGLAAADGSFRLPAVPGSPLEVFADHAGYYRQSLAPVSDRDPLVLALARSGITRGRVLDARGEPHQGLLRVSYEASPETETLVTEADGRFALPVRFRGRYRVACIEHGDTGSTWSDPPRVLGRSELLDGPCAGVEIRLDATHGWLHVRALGPDGRRIRRIAASASWLDPASAHRLLYARRGAGEVEADARGTARVAAPAAGPGATGVVCVRAEGFATEVRREVSFERDGQEVELRLVPEALIAGRVIDPDTGAGIAGADVQVLPPLQGDDTQGLLLAMLGRARLGDALATGPDGSFRIGGLARGKHQVWAEVDGRPAVRALHVTLQEGEQRQNLRLLLPRGGRVEGTITGAALPHGLRVLPSIEQGRMEGSRTTAAWVGLGGGAPVPHAGAMVAKGAFVLDGLSADLTGRLEVLVPSSPRLGPPIVMPLDILRVVAGATVREEYDVTRSLPARWRGRVQIDGDHIPMHRLRIVAGNKYGTVGGFGMERPARRAGVAPDGSFDLLVHPGTQRVRVEDVMTGVAFGVESVRLVSGQLLERNITISVFNLRVRLTPERGRKLVAEQLVVQSDAEEKPPFAIFQEDNDHGRAISLSCAPPEVELFVPPGRTTLTVLIDSDRLTRANPGEDPRGIERQVLGTTGFDARPGASGPLAIDVARPVGSRD